MSRRLRLLPVLAILIAALAGGFFYLKKRPRPVREAELKQDLRAMREAIDNYTFDKKQSSQTLQELVTAHYLNGIPTDPFTRRENWVLHFGDTVLSSEQTVTGIDDVHSASGQLARDGTPYNTW